MPKKVLLPVVFILLSASFGAGFYFGFSQIPSTPPEGILNAELDKAEGVDFSLFWEAWRTLEKNFVDPGKINYQKMVFGAVSGMVNSLKDPYTVFLPPEDSKIFKEDVSGEFQGVGMEIGLRNGQLTVISPLEGTPAKRAGLRAGDEILKVDGTYTNNMTVEEAVKLIRGPQGTKVILTIAREDWSLPRDIEITRDVIEIPSLKLEFKDNNIAYVRLYQFSETARAAFGQAVVDIINSPADKIILDLRDNPGGYLEVAQDIAGWFLEKDEIVTIEDFGLKQNNKEYKARGSGQLASYPLIVLINQGSASGSEILAGALRDNQGIKLLGQKSFGKGSVQVLEDLKQGTLKITVAKWLTPKGELIDGKGLVPDIEVELTEDDFNEGSDPQLDKAIEIINQMR